MRTDFGAAKAPEHAHRGPSFVGFHKSLCTICSKLGIWLCSACRIFVIRRVRVARKASGVELDFWFWQSGGEIEDAIAAVDVSVIVVPIGIVVAHHNAVGAGVLAARDARDEGTMSAVAGHCSARIPLLAVDEVAVVEILRIALEWPVRVWV